VERRRSEAEDQIAQLLRTARRKLDLSVAFLSRIDEATRTMQVVDTLLAAPADGYAGPRDSGFCLAVLEGRLPQVMPDVRDVPEAMALHPADLPQMRGHVSVPVVLSDGTVYGTFCAFGLVTDPEVSPRDLSLMEVLAEAAAMVMVMVIEPQIRLEQQHAEISDRLAPVMAAGGPDVVLQPIVDLGSGTRVDGYVSLNVSPQTLLTPACGELLASLPLERIVLELSEHDQVHDYPALEAALSPLRRRGMRLAIDDVGAGFSSLRHIVMACPDVLKMDRSIVSGVDHDPMLARLAQSLAEFAHSFDVDVVAEGVETAAEHAVLQSLGVDGGQGWLFGRPAPADVLVDAGTVLAPEPLTA
jgi:hypothetical protein